MDHAWNKIAFGVQLEMDRAEKRSLTKLMQLPKAAQRIRYLGSCRAFSTSRM